LPRHFLSPFFFLRKNKIPGSKAAEPTTYPNQQINLPNQARSGSSGQSANSGIISGYVYNDVNKNGERDPEEKPYPGATVKITQTTMQTQGASDQTSTLTTDTNGYFKFHFSNLNPTSVSYMVKLNTS